MFKQVATLIVTRGLTRGAQVISFLILARVLSPAGLGVYGVLTTAVLIATQLGNLGLRQASAYTIGRQTMADGEVGMTLLFLWPLLSAATVAGVLIFNGDLARQNGVVLPVAIAIAASLLLSLLQGVFLGRGEMQHFGSTDAAPRMLLSLFALGALALGAVTLKNAMWLFALSFALVAPFAIWLALKLARVRRLRLDRVPGMIRYGAIFAVSMVVISLNTRVGILILHGQVGETEAGQFFAGQRVNELFLEFATAAGLVLFSQSTKSGDPDQAITDGARTSAWMLWSFLGVSVFVVLFTPLFVRLVLGDAYMGAIGVIRILALGLAPAAVVKIMNGVVAGAGRPFLSAGLVGGGLVVNAALSYALAPELGADAAAYGLLGSQLSTMVGYVVVAKLLYGAPVRSFLLPHMDPVVLRNRLERLTQRLHR